MTAIPQDWIVQVLPDRDDRGLRLCKLFIPFLEWDSAQTRLHGTGISVNFSFDHDVSVMAIFYEEAPLYLHMHWDEWQQVGVGKDFSQWWRVDKAYCGLDIRLTYPSRVYILKECPLDPFRFNSLAFAMSKGICIRQSSRSAGISLIAGTYDAL